MRRKNRSTKDKNILHSNDNMPTFEWEKYDICKEYLAGRGIYKNVDKSHRFFEGNQWDSNAPADTPLPVVNIIKPTVNYKVSIVAQNNFQLNFSNTNFENTAFNQFANVVCKVYGNKTKNTWENNNLDAKLWDMLQEAAITGGVGLYSFWDDERGDIEVELKDNTEVLFGDEQEQDVQKQPYIIFPYRRTVAEIREEARENGVSEEDIQQIVADDDTNEQTGEASKIEIKNDDDFSKVLCLLFMYKKSKEVEIDGKKVKTTTVHISKSTKTVRFMEETDLKLSKYPLAFLTWEDVKGSARGKGEVLNLIPNQVEINKNYARRAVSIKQTAYPKVAYLREFVDNPEELMTVGTSIGLQGANASKVNDIVSYLRPAEQGTDAEKFCNELISLTKELAGAGDVALGNINPEQASGKAILAVKDAASTPLNRQVAKVKKFIEDIGRIWWDIYSVYGGTSFIMTNDLMGGLNQSEKSGAELLVQKVMLDKAKLLVRVDTTPTDPYSRYAEVASLENYMMQDKITFEEFLDVLPDDSIVPKDKLKQIKNTRKYIEGLMQENATLKAEKEQAQIRGAQEMQRITELIRTLQGNKQSTPK